MILGVRGSDGYLNTSSKADSDQESDEDFEIDKYPDAKQLRN